MRDGSAQIVDSGTAGFLGQTDLSHSFASSPTLSGTRSVVEQWGMLPVVDENNLRLLRMAYRRAVYGVNETLATDEELRNQLAHELKGQIAVTEDLRRSTDAYYQSRLSSGVFEYYQRLAEASGARPSPSGPGFGTQASRDVTLTTPSPDYGALYAQVVRAENECFDCQLGDTPVIISIKDGKPNQGYPLTIKGGQSVVWSNEGTDEVVITGDPGVMPFTSLMLSPGMKSSPILFRTPDRGGGNKSPGEADRDGLCYRVNDRRFYLNVSDEDACDEQEDTPARWVIDLAPEGAAPDILSTRLTLGEKGRGEQRLTIKSGDFVVWHNLGSKRVVVESAPGNPYRFQATVQPGRDSVPLHFPKPDVEAGVDGYRYQVRLPEHVESSPENVRKRDERDRSIMLAEQFLTQKSSTRKSEEERLGAAKRNRDPKLKEIQEGFYGARKAEKDAQDALNKLLKEEEVSRERIDLSPYGGIIGVIHVEPRKSKTPLTIEVCRRIREINKDLTDIESGWFGRGSKHDVPWKKACYVGRCGNCYTWVCPEGLASLSEFTLTVLSLASTVKETQVVTVPGGPRYSPGIPAPGR